jgi:predicted nucleic acid-binding protein
VNWLLDERAIIHVFITPDRRVLKNLARDIKICTITAQPYIRATRKEGLHHRLASAENFGVLQVEATQALVSAVTALTDIIRAH